jgi:hypothetical protein
MSRVPHSFSRGEHPMIGEVPLLVTIYGTGSQQAPSGVKLESAAVLLKQA